MLTSSAKKVIRQPELVQIVGLSRSTLADLQNRNSPRFDETFPAKVRLGKRAVGWFLADIEAWLNGRQVERNPVSGGNS